MTRKTFFKTQITQFSLNQNFSIQKPTPTKTDLQNPNFNKKDQKKNFKIILTNKKTKQHKKQKMPQQKKANQLQKQPGMFGIGTAAGIPVQPSHIMIFAVVFIVLVIIGHILSKIF